jgi:hypothetical protein
MTGHDTSPETIEKIKAARAEQDESQRLNAWNDWKEQKLTEDPEHFKKIGGRASKEDTRATTFSITFNRNFMKQSTDASLNIGEKCVDGKSITTVLPHGCVKMGTIL